MIKEHKIINRYCLECGWFYPVRLYCGDRLCSECKKNNYYRLLDYYLPLIKKIPSRRLSQMTLTYRNFSFLNTNQVLSIGKDFKRLRDSNLFRSKVKGGLSVIEIKHASDSAGWNLHIHALLDSSFVSQSELSKVWFGITGHSYIVDIRQEENSSHAIKHLLKYFLKTPVILGANESVLRNDFNRAFKRSRNVVSFGSLYNVVKEDKLPYRFKCPVCGSTEWINEFQLLENSLRAYNVRFAFG